MSKNLTNKADEINQADKDIITKIDEDTILITSQKHQKEAMESLENAMYNYNTTSNFRSTYFNEQSTSVNFTIADIESLALNAQSNLNSILRINNIVRFFINKNDILGKVYESIETNVNPEWFLTFPKYEDEDEEVVEEVKNIIQDFNKKIDIDKLIVNSIPMTYSDGNYIIYLRKDTKNLIYQVDYFPLGIAEIADYNEGGEPYVLINIKELESRLRKIYKKNRKNQPLFYNDIDEEIKATYPSEVYNAYKDKEQYAILDIKNSGVIRINNFKRKYGLSPIFKALKPVIRLENIELSDDKNTLVRGKKIIFQKLHKELITQAKDIPNITWHSAQAKAHSDLMSALNANGVSVFTGLPWTEKVEYVEPKMEQTNVQVKNHYKNEIMAAVGISYLSVDKGSYGLADISIKELLKMINRISSQLEKILQKWYAGLLIDHGIDLKYLPSIKVIDSEQLSNEIRLQLAEVLFNKLSCSYDTVYKILGLNADDEFRRRKYEKENGYDEVFMPHLTSYTSNPDSNDTGRPPDSKDKDRQEYDNDYNKEVRT